MIIKLKNKKKYRAESLREERLRNGSSYIWNLRFIITTPVNSDELDENLTNDNISTFSALSDDGSESLTFTGYKSIAGVSILFDEGSLSSRCAVQLQKIIESEATSNGTLA